MSWIQFSRSGDLGKTYKGVKEAKREKETGTGS
jgi:hypothetical protein